MRFTLGAASTLDQNSSGAFRPPVRLETAISLPLEGLILILREVL
jgi:hypothetical protein